MRSHKLKKKGMTGMTLWIVIAAVLALVVLYTMIIGTTKSSTKLGVATSRCEPANGKCVPQGQCGGIPLPVFECSQGQECCGGLLE